MYKYSHPVEAMSTINPRLTKQLSIAVAIYDINEGPIPHVHVFFDRTRDKRKSVVIRLDKAEYSHHHGDPTRKLNKKEKEQFVRLMTSKWPNRYVSYQGNPVEATGYQYAVDIWVESFEDGSYDKFTLDENGVPVMPNYENL